MAESSSKAKYSKKQWFAGVSKDRAGGGGRGGGRGGGGGDRGRGGGGRGGRGGRGGGRGGFSGGGGGGGDGEQGDKQHHLGRYRDKHLPEILTKRGIMATAILNKEKSAERELMECLEDASRLVADELYPETIEKDEADEGEGDLEDMLKRELEGMSAKAKKSNRFRLCQHETICVFYVNVMEPLDPVKLVHRILERAEQTGRVPFRYLKRIVPMSATTNATIPALKGIAKTVVQDGFATPDNRSLTYGIMPNTRSSQKLDRLEMIKAVADVVTDLEVKHTVDLKNQERTIIIELNKGVVGMSVVQDYYKYAKYNPIAVAEQVAAQRIAAEKANDAADSSTNDVEMTTVESEKKPSQAAISHAGRDKRAEQMAQDHLSSPSKRKAVELGSEGAPARTEEDVERGEVLEGVEGDATQGDEWEEVIEGGKVMKMRKVEAGQ